MTELYDKILGFVDSNSMRAHLRSHRDELRAYDWLAIVTCAPRSLEEKIEVLQALAEEDPEKREYVMRYYEAAKTAWERLTESDTDDWLLMLTRKERSGAYGQTNNVAKESIPVRTFRHALQYMNWLYARACEKCKRHDVDPRGSEPDWFWEVSLYYKQEPGERYTFVCTYKGEVQYFRVGIREQLSLVKGTTKEDVDTGVANAALAFAGGAINLSVPYQPGDILYIDCRPYTEPTWCVITEVIDDDDSRNVRCLFPVCCGLVREGALKEGDCFWRYPGHDGEDDCISPLFRAEIYDGELPKKYAFLKKISRAVKDDPILGDKVFDYTHKAENHYTIKLIAAREGLTAICEGNVTGMKPDDLFKLIDGERGK